MEKKNTGLKVLVITLSVLVVSLLGYIIYDKILNNNKEIETNNEVTNRVSKLDDSKYWVHDANYNLPTTKESYYGGSDHTKLIKASDLVVPYININSFDATKKNQEIYKLYEELIAKFNANLKGEIFFTLVEYQTYISNNVLSIVIRTESAGTDIPLYEYYTYSFNLNTGNLLTYEETYKMVGFTANDIDNETSKAITKALKEIYPSTETDFETYNQKSINNYKTSINSDTIRFFVNDNNKLNVIVTLEFPAGRGTADTIITVE